MEKEMTSSGLNSRSSGLKFFGCSIFGLAMFLCPMGGGEGFNTPLSVLTDSLDKWIGANAPWLLVCLVVAAALLALGGLFMKPSERGGYKLLREIACVSKVYLLTRLAAAVIALGVSFGVGPAWVIGDDVGGSMMGLGQTLIALAVTLSFILPFLTDSGIMEFVGILLKPLVRPLFHVPGRASVDLIASWLSSSNTAVLITAGQYQGGFYSRREAACIMTNFSLVSIPFCLVVAETLKVADHFLLLYASVTAIGLLLAVIGVRLFPLAAVPNDYRGEKRLAEEVPPEATLLRWAFRAALERAGEFSFRKAFEQATAMTLGIIFDLIPVVVAWGTIGSILVNETSIFHWLAYPMGMYMQLLGVEGAFQIAPATLVGFIDMFIPALITSADLPYATRFVVAALSLVQIIYLTEVGSIIVKSDVGLDMKRLFLIFIERTLIALPLIVLVTKLL